MIENVLNLVQAAAEPQATQVNPGTSFHSWCYYHVPSEGAGKSLTIHVRGVPLTISSSDRRYHHLEVLAPNKSALRFTGYDKSNGPYIAVELAKSNTRNEAARIATAPDSIVHDATNVQEFLKALFSIKSRGASILDRLVPPGAAHAAAEPELPTQAGDAFAKLWLEFMPREKTVTVQGVSVVLESMDSHPNSIEATLPGGVTYSLSQSLLPSHEEQYRIWRVGARKTGFDLISGKLQPRVMLSRFLQLIIVDWKKEPATAATEPRPVSDLLPELQRYAGKLKLDDKLTKNKVVFKSANKDVGHNIQLTFLVRQMVYNYNAINTGGVFLHALEDTKRVLLNLGGRGDRYTEVDVSGHKLSLTEDAAQTAKKALVLLMRALLSQANTQTKKTSPPAFDLHPRERTSQAASEPSATAPTLARLFLDLVAHTKRKLGSTKHKIRVRGRDVYIGAGFGGLVLSTVGDGAYQGTYKPRTFVARLMTDVDRTSFASIEVVAIEPLQGGVGSRVRSARDVDDLLQKIVLSYMERLDHVASASAEPEPDPRRAISKLLESWVGRVYSRAGEYVAGIQSVSLDMRGGTTFPQRDTLMIVTSVQRGREILGTTPHHVILDPKTHEIVVLANPGSSTPDQIGRARITDYVQAAKWILHTIATKADPLRSWR